LIITTYSFCKFVSVSSAVVVNSRRVR